jgi:hypothetical protein
LCKNNIECPVHSNIVAVLLKQSKLNQVDQFTFFEVYFTGVQDSSGLIFKEHGVLFACKVRHNRFVDALLRKYDQSESISTRL